MFFRFKKGVEVKDEVIVIRKAVTTNTIGVVVKIRRKVKRGAGLVKKGLKRLTSLTPQDL